eukprot:14520101-Heterocapsa_arctica.AAC.1
MDRSRTGTRRGPAPKPVPRQDWSRTPQWDLSRAWTGPAPGTGPTPGKLPKWDLLHTWTGPVLEPVPHRS